MGAWFGFTGLTIGLGVSSGVKLNVILWGLEAVFISIFFSEVLLTVTVFTEKNVPLYPRDFTFSAYIFPSLVAWQVRVFVVVPVAVSTHLTMKPSHNSPLVPVDVVLE